MSTQSLITYPGFTLRQVKTQHKSRPPINCWAPPAVPYTGAPIRQVKTQHKSRPPINCWAAPAVPTQVPTQVQTQACIPIITYYLM